MNKGFLRLVVSAFMLLLLVNVASAYYYGGDYKKEYAVKETYDQYGYSYYQKSTDKNPWGETTSYTKVKDYDGYRPYYERYNNKLYDYWSDGPYTGYSKSYGVVSSGDRYLGYGWDDSYRRDVYDSQYHPYYYEPRYFYNGNNYNWHGSNEPYEPRCGIGSTTCKSVSYCGNTISHCSW